MDITSASALATYDYQNAFKASGQSTAVLQALTQTYANQNGLLAGEASTPDTLDALAGSGALGSLVAGIFSTAMGDGGSTSAFLGMIQASSAAASLFSGGSSSPNLGASEALAAYAYQQTAAGSSGSASTAASYVERLASDAQFQLLAAPLDLLA